MFSTVHHDLEGLAADRFRSLAEQLRRLQGQGAAPDRLDAICRDELTWMQSATGLNGCREKYEACVRLITDLAKLRWQIVQDGFGIEFASPPIRQVAVSEIKAYKQGVRQELHSQFRLQFAAKPARDFIRRMESPGHGGKRPVTELVADGRELRSRLLAARDAHGDKRTAHCREAVRPYLQLVESGKTDEFTGQALSDIWRYFRYTWVIPATNVPGRNLFYLIRDAAHPSHAVMGITALSNAPLSMKDRDDRLGWTAGATQRAAVEVTELPEADATTMLYDLLDTLERNLEEGLNAISHDELLSAGEAASPTEAVIQRLRRRAAEFAALRQEVLSDEEQPFTVNELEDMEYGTPEVSDVVLALESKVFGDEKMNAARRALTAKKRAAELARLLQARMTLRKYRERLLDPEQAGTTYGLDEVASAVNSAWISAKNARAGTSMLELTVCGAVRPYNQVLGGKLAALLMLSPEVADDYTRRYGDAVSIISSMMKNEPVVKDSRLVFLGTTSLYLHGASQYNRLRLPAGTISPEQQEIRYERMGETGGFGTVQFSAGTVEAIERVVRKEKGYRQVNSVFGEGRSPKLRKLRTGLDALGFDPEMLLQHHQPRVIYGISLFPGVDRFLRTGRDDMPDFICRPAEFRDATERIADFWTRRWLAKRLDYDPVFERLADCPAWKLSDSVPLEETPDKNPASIAESPRAPMLDSSLAGSTGLRLWQSLAAAGHDSCSDCVDEADLDRLHVPMPLEEFLLAKAEEGFSIVLTGNAGDGKTHLLRRLAPALERTNALVDLDATAVMRMGSVLPILERWRGAIAEGRPYCIAANEYPLHLLIQHGKGNLPDPLHQELTRQTRERLAYSPQPTPEEDAREKLLVLDLSLRNPLTASFSLAALQRMLGDPAVIAHATSGTDPDFAWNHRQLSSPRVQERLGALFQRLADRGHRCTIRELWITLARMLFGEPGNTGQTPHGSPNSWYSTRLWFRRSGGGGFRLAEILEANADPAACSHPYWDAQLEHPAEMDPGHWLSGIPPMDFSHWDPKVVLQRFGALKRRFYFEHERGDEVFSLAGGHGANFPHLLSGAATADDVFKGRLLRAINHAYCPCSFSGCDRDLHLWFSHRYHEQPTRAYVANRSVPTSAFTVRLPRLPSRLQDAFDYRPDHLLLECPDGDRTIRLLIDAPLHAALMQLATGFPRHLAPESELNKLDDFLSRLQRTTTPQSRQFLVYSAESRLATRITLDEDLHTYLEVEKL